MKPAAWIHLGNRRAGESQYVPQNIEYHLPWYEVLSVSPNWPGLSVGVLVVPLTDIVLPWGSTVEVEIHDVDFGDMQGTITDSNPRGTPSNLGDRSISIMLNNDPYTARCGQQIRAPAKKRGVLSFVCTLDEGEHLAGQVLTATARHDAGSTPISVAGNDLWLKYWEAI